MTIKEAIKQIEFCEFECSGGKLENNIGWKALLAHLETAEEVEKEPYKDLFMCSDS